MYQDTIQDGKKYVEEIATALNLDCPEIDTVAFWINKHYGNALRGVYDSGDNTIKIASNYNWKGSSDFERTIRHEICEWLRYTITGQSIMRLKDLHSSDSIFNGLMRVVRKRNIADIKRYYDNRIKKLNK